MSRVFFRCVHVCVCVCVSTLKQKLLDISVTKLGRWIVHDKSWSPILFQMKGLNVKVTG